MTLEEKVFRVWGYMDDASIMSTWHSTWADSDFERESDAVQATEKVIRENIIEGLTSNNRYIRRYAQLLSAEGGEVNNTKEICYD